MNPFILSGDSVPMSDAGPSQGDDADKKASASQFKQLTDAPASYTGQAGKYVRVNAMETAVEFTSTGRLTRFYDEINFTPHSGIPAPALANLPYQGNAQVGDSIFFGSPDSPVDSGIWVIDAITYGTPGDIATASATLSRRSDSVVGAVFTSGEFVYSTYDGNPHFVGLTDTVSNENILEGKVGDTLLVYSSDIVNPQTVQAAMAQYVTKLGSGVIGAPAVQIGFGKVTHANSPYDFPPSSYSGGLPEVLLIDASAGDVTVTIYGGNVFLDDTAKLVTPLKFKRVDSSSHVVTITTDNPSTVKFDGTSSTITLGALQSKTVIYDDSGPTWLNGGAGGSAWWIV